MTRTIRCLLGGMGMAAALACAAAIAPMGDRALAASGFRLEFLGRHNGGGVGAAEIAAYDRRSQRLFVTNATDNALVIIDISDPSAPTEVNSIDLSPYGAGPNSVAVSRGKVAVAVEVAPKTDPGVVVFFDTDGNFRSQVQVGALPDMLTFTPDGTYLLVANEGELNSYNQPDSVDPEGSISIINTSHGRVNQTDVRTASFRKFNGEEAALRAQGIRIFGPNASAAQDLEPEYIAVSSDSRTAWVTLQENNAFAIVDIQRAAVRRLAPLGFKDHSLGRNKLDASDRDNGINIRRWPVRGMYMPDAIAAFEVDGRTYLITANEGDARDYDGFAEEARVKDLKLDRIVDPALKDENKLGRLTVTSVNGDIDGDGDFDQLFAFGGRSFSIWNARGRLIFDSGDQLEQITAAALPNEFNSNNDEDNSFDSRSDNKGPEPEGVTVGKAFGRTFAFVGMERIGGIATFEISDPRAPVFQHYLNTRVFDGDDAVAGDSGPEGLLFIPRGGSPTGEPLVVAIHEISGTTTVYALRRSPGGASAARPH
ncbi:MAG: alkaline phosphatase [Rhizobiales bacterium]|nr:alkaline phosphatase [Hyphomicrobiales bacterium]